MPPDLTDKDPTVSSPKRSPTPLDRTITHRLHTLSKITDRVSQAAYESDAGIPFSEGRCLAAIGAFSPLSVNDLAQRANLNKGQASRAAQSWRGAHPDGQGRTGLAACDARDRTPQRRDRLLSRRR
jgi:hypothetical protein